MKRKIASVILALSMCLSMSTIALGDNSAPESRIDALVDAKIMVIREEQPDVSEQMLGAYEEYLTMKYSGQLDINNLNIQSTEQTYNYYIPNGALITYSYNSFLYGRCDIAIMCLDHEDTLEYVLSGSSDTWGEILGYALGWIPVIGNAVGALTFIQAVVDSYANSRISEAGGYAVVETLYSGALYDTLTTVDGWYDYPRYSVTADFLSGPEIERFP